LGEDYSILGRLAFIFGEDYSNLGRATPILGRTTPFSGGSLHSFGGAGEGRSKWIIC